MAERPWPPRIGRTVEALAGLLSAGVLVLGVVLAVLKFAAPALMAGSGLSAAQGPRLDRILVPLVIGALGETSHHYRARFPVRWRPAIAGAVVIGAVAALWWGWWG